MLIFDTWIGDSESEILRTKIFMRYINSCFFERLAYFWYYYHILGILLNKISTSFVFYLTDCYTILSLV